MARAESGPHRVGMNAINPNETVSEITRRVPGAARVFERYSIDYCCGGKRPLRDACDAAQKPLGEVLDALLHAAYEPGDLMEVPSDVAGMIHYIFDKHHVWERNELTRLAPLADKVCRVHGDRHPELHEIRALLKGLTADILPHMIKEEQVLFPYLLALSSGSRDGACFATVRQPIHVMEIEHQAVGALLADLDKVTSHFVPPTDACMSYRALFEGLRDLTADIHRHVFIENERLFPAAVALEQGVVRKLA